MYAVHLRSLHPRGVTKPFFYTFAPFRRLATLTFDNQGALCTIFDVQPAFFIPPVPYDLHL